ncbi:hypothetical protein Zmor_025135 [Zophobas morio]|uniref:Uncharacterized protein n=1 Tax=Zophobas morio TaxID=2755281 RepID=A0AA38M4C9_9CUCU|nr:hypothetical protein Zmor_025135 [Zophobas morio]
MGLCANDTKRRRPFKTIIIPRGIINPYEHNVIEIPLNLDTASNLIVKAPTDANSCFSVEPYRGNVATPPPQPMVQPYPGEVNLPVAGPTPQVISTDSGARVCPQDGITCIKTTYSNDRPRKVDFCGQTPNPYLPTKKWSTCDQLIQSSFNLPERRPLPVPEAHSPLCPICARASCKYLSNSGINRPYSSRFSHFSPTLGQRDPPNPSNIHFAIPTATYRDPYRSPYLPTERTESIRPREKVDNEALSRMVDEKIEKILKPVLFSLGKLSPEDDDREKYLASTGPSKFSYSSIRPKQSREQCNPRKYEDDYRVRNPSPYEAPDYEDLRRETRRRDSDYLGGTTRSSFRSTDFDPDESRRRPACGDRDPCPPNASCQKRVGVSFDDTGNKSISSKLNERLDLNAPSNESLLNKRI